MIIIVGSSVDDILYFAAKLKNKKTYTLFKKYKVLLGTILNRPVCLLSEVYSDYLTSALVSHLIEKFHAIMVFNVGICRSYTNDFKKGDIAISRQVILGDVNMVGVDKCLQGQIPSMPQSFISSPYVSGIIREGALRVVASGFKMSNFVSINTYEKHKSDLAKFEVDGRIFGQNDHIIIDSESGGAAVACQLYDIPFMAIKVVEGQVDEVLKEDVMFDAYKQYPNVGKIITYCIGEIGRNDMIEEDSVVEV